MPNEIKEILELLREDLYIPQEDNREYKLLDKGDDKLLLDYITNLQEENERVRAIKWQIKNLKQEWLDIVENETLVFDNDNLLNFMNKLERILRGDE